MWTKIKKHQGRGPNGGQPARESFAVSKQRRGDGAFSCNFLLPVSFCDRAGVKQGHACDILEDGFGRLGFLIHHGEPTADSYKVALSGPKAKALRVAIPVNYAGAIPHVGTTDIDVEFDGDMIVVDLNQLARRRVAAE